MTRTTKNFAIIANALLLSIAFLLIGCASREHMSTEHGKQNREFYAKQRVYLGAAKEPPQGLDSEEAAIGHATYRKNLGGGAAAPADTGSRVLVIEESDRNEKK